MITYDMRDLADESLYEYLYRKIREDILAGRLKKGERMPSKRSFAKNQGVAVITVENAYSQLVAEGYLYSEPRRGFFVSQIDESLRLPQTAPLKIESEEVKSAGDSIGEEAGLPGISGSEAVPAAAAGREKGTEPGPPGGLPEIDLAQSRCAKFFRRSGMSFWNLPPERELCPCAPQSRLTFCSI